MDILLFGKALPAYGLFMYAGILSASAVGLLLCRKRGFPIGDLVGAGAYALIGALIGSKLLFLAVSWKEILELKLPPEAIIKGGFVFYGGLLGGLLGIVIYAAQFRMALIDFLELFAVPLPLGHAFGRMGCYCAGCCYGIVYDGPGHVVYHTSADLNTPLGTPLFPVQAIGAAGLLCLFAVLLTVFLCSTRKGAACYVYVVAYPLLRFAVEFLRGDTERGLLFGLSTAQWVSAAILLCLAIGFAVRKRKRNAESADRPIEN